MTRSRDLNFGVSLPPKVSSRGTRSKLSKAYSTGWINSRPQNGAEGHNRSRIVIPSHLVYDSVEGVQNHHAATEEDVSRPAPPLFVRPFPDPVIICLQL